MNRKTILIGVLLALAAGAGIIALVKSRRAASESAEGGMSPTLVAVQTGALRRVTLHGYVSGYGTVEPAPATAEQPAAGAQLAAPSPGVVSKVNVIEGAEVQKGAVLMELDSGATTADSAAQEVARQKTLYAQENTSLRSLQAAEAQLALLRVTAPLSGTVVRLNVKPGQAVDLTTIVAEVMDLNRLSVSAEIPAAEAVELKPGDPVELRVEPPVTSELSFISPVVDKDKGAVLVRALLPAGGALRPGQFVPLRIVTAVHTNCLAAPAESVVTDEGGRSVIALVRGDEAVQAQVRAGLSEDGWTEIEAPGLKAGDAVVTVGAYGLPEKTRIRIGTPSGGEPASTNPPSAK
jgi:membrane fusion protein (multidrug efflux system)